MLIDQFRRKATDLRISVTDRCNYKCVYCMPSHVEWLPKPEILSYEEMETLAHIFASEGVTEIRVTGGEPLARRDVHKLIAKLIRIPGIEDVSVTTNGYYLKEQAQALKEAGIRRINISLDSLQEKRFREITRSSSFDRVMAGIREAQKVGFDPIKINCVVIRGFNDDEIVDFLEWGASQNLQIRFIEFMPLDGDHQWKRVNVLTKAEILQRAGEFGRVHPIFENEISPASRYLFAERGEFGVIPSVSEPFCARCSRIRITADGKFRTCLFATEETDLRTLLRSGASEEEIVELIRSAVFQKWAGHHINDPDFVQPQRAMYAIGG
jgi:GTP 3',8-cyclase